MATVGHQTRKTNSQPTINAVKDSEEKVRRWTPIFLLYLFNDQLIRIPFRSRGKSGPPFPINFNQNPTTMSLIEGGKKERKGKNYFVICITDSILIFNWSKFKGKIHQQQLDWDEFVGVQGQLIYRRRKKEKNKSKKLFIYNLTISGKCRLNALYLADNWTGLISQFQRSPSHFFQLFQQL